jgi:hypothetical protein
MHAGAEDAAATKLCNPTGSQVAVAVNGGSGRRIEVMCNRRRAPRAVTPTFAQPGVANMKKFVLGSLVALAVGALSAPVAMAATDAQKEAVKEKWQSMTPEQQAEKKAALKARYDAMTPEQQEALKKRLRDRRHNAAASASAAAK